MFVLIELHCVGLNVPKKERKGQVQMSTRSTFFIIFGARSSALQLWGSNLSSFLRWGLDAFRYKTTRDGRKDEPLLYTTGIVSKSLMSWKTYWGLLTAWDFQRSMYSAFVARFFCLSLSVLDAWVVELFFSTWSHIGLVEWPWYSASYLVFKTYSKRW